MEKKRKNKSNTRDSTVLDTENGFFYIKLSKILPKKLTGAVNNVLLCLAFILFLSSIWLLWFVLSFFLSSKLFVTLACIDELLELQFNCFDPIFWNFNSCVKTKTKSVKIQLFLRKHAWDIYHCLRFVSNIELNWYTYTDSVFCDL